MFPIEETIFFKNEQDFVKISFTIINTKYISGLNKNSTWYLRLFWETTWRALTCTAFTAFLEVSTRPFVMLPNKLDCAAVSLELSSATGDFGDNLNPRLLVKRAKVDFPTFPLDESSWEEPEND